LACPIIVLYILVVENTVSDFVASDFFIPGRHFGTAYS
jgi:hypothetical protein